MKKILFFTLFVFFIGLAYTLIPQTTSLQTQKKYKASIKKETKVNRKVDLIKMEMSKLKNEVAALKKELKALTKYIKVGEDSIKIKGNNVFIGGNRIHIGSGFKSVRFYAHATFHRKVYFQDEIHGLYHSKD